MSEELVAEIVDEVVEVVEEVELSPEEEEAVGKGWSPEGGAEGRRSLTAEEFLDRQPLYDKIHKSERAVKRMQESQSALQSHLDMLQDSINKQQVDQLKQQKLTALEEGEHNRVMEIDEKIIDIHSAPKAPEVAPDTTEFDNWADSNTWYDSDIHLKRYADAVGAEYATKYGQLDTAALNKITEEVKQAFPDKFTQSRTRPSPVEGAGRPSNRAQAPKYTTKDLDDTARNVMRTLVRDGTYDNDAAYIESLVQSGYFS